MGARVTLLRGRFDVADVVADPGQPQQPALLVEHAVDLVGRKTQVAQEEEDDPRVEIPGAGAHDESLQGSEPHAGIDGSAVVDGRDAGPVAQMGHHHLEFREPAAQEAVGLLGHRREGDAVEAVSAHAVLDLEVVRQSVGVGLLRHGGMKSRVKDRHLRRIGKDAQRLAYAHQDGRVVEWSEVGALFDLGDDLRSEGRRGVEVAAPVYHPVTDRLHLGDVVQHAGLRIHERLHDQLQASPMSGDGHLAAPLRLSCLGVDSRALLPDAADQAARQDRTGGSVAELVLDGRTAAVEGEYSHRDGDLRSRAA